MASPQIFEDLSSVFSILLQKKSEHTFLYYPLFQDYLNLLTLNHTYHICEELSLSCNRNQWDLDPDGLWAEHEKGIDDWLTKEIRENRK